MKIAVVGGGPAGLLAAFEASKRYAGVTLFDGNPNPGRKLASTGSGRGNLTNCNISAAKYHSFENLNRTPFPDLIHKYDYHFLSHYFEEIGINMYHTDDGWNYPLSNAARNVADFLAELVREQNVVVNSDVWIKKITKKSEKFELTIQSEKCQLFDRIILATGGRAYPQLGSSTEILNSIHRMGHKLVEILPALAPIETSKQQSGSLNGVRLDALIKFFSGTKIIGESFGNIIFTDWGINGPGVMNISHLTHNPNREMTVEIDCLHDHRERMLSIFRKYRNSTIGVQKCLMLLLPQKIVRQILNNAQVDYDKAMVKLDKKEIDTVIDNCVIRENLLGTREFLFSQLSTGGISTSNVNPMTLESTIVPGLFFAGEVLDVLGPCGGFNLHWAFISGIICGQSV